MKFELDEYGVQEMSHMDMKKTDGGAWWKIVLGFVLFATAPVTFGVGAVAGAALAVSDNWD
ncbi:hypothetical protein [Larkinella punicea]|uniref:Bacteriocin n=1 Tax=Larkinella punicea TaxID=2315727 RepID=A0A368JHP6_9BACT|nr:hypothetical protein [Larkinella punicea]RCR65611.1 hypothetical protein DUE52_30895 [Larkinella punicea]